MRVALPLLCLVVLTAGAANAATFLVRQDGAGDYLTIQAAIAVSSSGDIILVGPGTYTPGLMQITFGLTFRSEGGPDQTIIDGEGVSRLFWFDGVGNSSVEGFTIRGGYMAGQNGQGSGIFLWRGATVAVSNCIFADNWVGWDGGAVFARDAGTSTDISDCLFNHNSSSWNGGACGVSLNASMTISDCRFIENSSYICGAVAAYGATLNVSGSIFLRNSADGPAGVRMGGSTGQILNNTFHANISQTRATVLMDTSRPTTVLGNIITADAVGGGLEAGPYCTHDWNILFDNAAGDILGGTPSANEFLLDPMYCNYPLGDLSLCSTSLGLPTNNGWGLIGALSQGCNSCGPIGIREETWGGVKGLYNEH